MVEFDEIYRSNFASSTRITLELDNVIMAHLMGSDQVRSVWKEWTCHVNQIG